MRIADSRCFVGSHSILQLSHWMPARRLMFKYSIFILGLKKEIIIQKSSKMDWVCVFSCWQLRPRSWSSTCKAHAFSRARHEWSIQSSRKIDNNNNQMSMGNTKTISTSVYCEYILRTRCSCTLDTCLLPQRPAERARRFQSAQRCRGRLNFVTKTRNNLG